MAVVSKYITILKEELANPGGGFILSVSCGRVGTKSGKQQRRIFRSQHSAEAETQKQRRSALRQGFHHFISTIVLFTEPVGLWVACNMAEARAQLNLGRRETRKTPGSTAHQRAAICAAESPLLIPQGNYRSFKTAPSAG
jgi:predicted DNA-binding WGR domain protein